MRSEFRRIIAVEAHRRRTGHCPLRVYSLGTGEIFDIEPAEHGFRDLASGLDVTVLDDRIELAAIPAAIDLEFSGDVAFHGYDHSGAEPFSGRAGGGASVTIYDRGQNNYFQYAISTATERL